MSHEIQNYNPPNNVGNDDEEIDNPTDGQPDDWSDPPNDQSTEVKALETMVCVFLPGQQLQTKSTTIAKPSVDDGGVNENSVWIGYGLASFV